jgi:hypothetical protein
MMRRLRDCRSTAFAEADADLRSPAIFRGENTPESHAGLYRAHSRPPYFPPFPPPEPFRHTRTESRKNIQSP